MKTNLGPKGTVKMLVGGAGDLKLTKARVVLRNAPRRRRGCSARISFYSGDRSRAGRERAAARDADPEPHSHYDCAHGSGTGRRLRARLARAARARAAWSAKGVAAGASFSLGALP